MSTSWVRKHVSWVMAAVAVAVLAAIGTPAAAWNGHYQSAPYSARLPRFRPLNPEPVVREAVPFVYVLPGGCAPVQVGAVIYNDCAGVWYSPYFYGPNVVYTQVPRPY